MTQENYNTDMASSVGTYVHDAEPSVQLRIDLATPVTATGNNTAIDFSLKAAGQAMANITVSASDAGDTDETYQLVLQADAKGGFSGNEITIGALDIPRGYTGSLGIPFYGPGIVRLLKAAGIIADDNEDTAIRMRHVIGGTTPSMNYVAQIGPVIGGL